MITKVDLLERGFREITEEQGYIYIKSRVSDYKDALARIVAAKYTIATNSLVVEEIFVESDDTIEKNEILSAVVEYTGRLDKLLEMFFDED